MATPASPSADCIKDFYNKICRHFRFISIKRKDTKEEQKKWKLASLIGICGFLMQTKAYLFWRV